MAKVDKRTARKDYPDAGIKRGDTYYYTSLKLQRGGIIKRSLLPFKPSQLTTSTFKSGWLSTQESFDASSKDADDIRAAAEDIRGLGEDAQGSFDNMPEGLQQGDTGQMIENRVSECERVADQLEGLADEMGEMEEPVEPEDEMSEEMDGQDRVDLEEAHDEYQAALAEYNERLEAIPDEANDLLGEMPE